MGLFDIFKTKTVVKEAAVHPLQEYLKEANLAIENLQVVDANGTVTITGSAQDGQSADKVKELLRTKRIPSLTNNITIADVSHFVFYS